MRDACTTKALAASWPTREACGAFGFTFRMYIDLGSLRRFIDKLGHGDGLRVMP